MKRLLFVCALAGLGLFGFAGACNLLNPSLTRVGGNNVYGAELQNNTGANFLAHSFKVAFVDASGTVVETRSGVPGCLRSWQNGASDFFSVRSSLAAGATTAAIGSLDLTSPLVVGTTVPTAASLSAVTAATPPLAAANSGGVASMTVAGTLKNNDAVTLANPNVCVVVFNSSGQVVLTQRQSLASLAAGAQTSFSFSVSVPDSAAAVSRVVIWVDGIEGEAPTTPVQATATLSVTTPTATNTAAATNTPPPPTATNTAVPTATNTAAPTATNTPLPTDTPTTLPTATNTAVPTATNTSLPTDTPTTLPTATNTAVPTATNTAVPTATNTAAPTATNTPLPTDTPTTLPTATNTA
ncbi:MAG: hypothetical protein IVW36_12420, partial [Dehalococcoidia bacterium]|nr:hypothetical protein [Dehalococcoidia bacterium]